MPVEPTVEPDPADRKDVTTEVPVTVAAPGTDVEEAPVEAWDDDWTLDDEPVSGGVDPLLARMGALAIIVTLLIPVLFSLGSDGDDTSIESAIEAVEQTVTSPPAPTVAPIAASPSEDSAAGDPAVSTGGESAEPTPAAAEPTATEAASPTAASSDDDPSARAAEPATTSDATDATAQSNDTSAPSDVIAESAGAETGAERIEPPCPIEYEVVVGDYWIRIADGAGVPIAELLAANGATTNTPLYPGATICLPAGATIPAPPTTTVPPTTVPPTTVPPTTAAPTTTTTTTTTTAPSSSGPASPEEVQQLIREIFPPDQHAKALDVAWKESSYRATAYNGWCCYGVFQIYWDVHKGWLDDFGIYQSSDLFDAEKNIRAAYHLYQQSGGWSPWTTA